MKFIVSSSLLLKQLQAISGVLSTNNTLPILDNFLFELTDTEIKISASDLETTMIARINVDMSEGEGSVAIPAKILLDTLKTFSDIPVTLDIDEINYGVTLIAGEGKYKLAGQNGDEYPKVPAIESDSTFSIESDVLFQAINKTLFAASNDDLRPVMAGVFCEIGQEGTTFVATDAHKLVRYSRLDVKSNDEASFILPKKPLNQLKHILAQDDDTVKVDYSNTNARFTFRNIIMVCRLIDGKYPNYSAVIPLENPNKMTVDRNPFLTGIRRVSIFSNKTTYQVKLRIAGSELTLSAEDLDYSNEARERLACSYEGEDLEIGFNSRFLVEMLQNLDTEQVRLEMSEPNRAGLIIPVDNENKDEDILMLVMPVMLNA
ncbi:MAG: DNA polymerase III subunit beta [Bacteroidales bacterium]|jgi:DNA polymerase-3 subunit beta|nr:DNA polymerase III subunit beta [Bacteroidales bacterium]NLM91368.1 DNA polymerase III subunit beta [Bacteroidales bacterium]